MATETIRSSLYNGSVEIDFYPNSHRYKLITQDGEKSGEWLQSPSSILNKLDKSQALIPWAINCYTEKMLELCANGSNFTRDDIESMLSVAKTAHTEQKTAAGSIGSVVHDFAQLYTKSVAIDEIEGFFDLPQEDQEKARKGAEAFVKWVQEINPVFINSEFTVYSKKNRFVGTCDALVEIDGAKYILDYKTSKGVYSSHIYQVASYLKAYEEETGDRLEGAKILSICKEDVLDKEGNVIKEAGQFKVVPVSRQLLVTAYKAFKALQVVNEIDKQVTKQLYAN